MSSTSVNLHLAQEGGRGRIWGTRPFQLMSLIEMLPFYAGVFYHALLKLESLKQLCLQNPTCLYIRELAYKNGK
jgi:hypothetical protein